MSIRLKQFLFYTLCLILINSCNGQEEITAQLVPQLTTEQKEDIRQPVYVSTDQGYTWTPLTKGLPAYAEGSFLDTIGQELILATDNVGLFLTTDGRTNWKNISGKLPNPKINALWTEGDQIFVGVYKAGVYTTSDFGKNWINITYDLNDKKVQALRLINKELYVGIDSGISRLDQDTQTWVPLFTGAQILSL